MKKYVSALVGLAVLPMFSANAESVNNHNTRYASARNVSSSSDQVKTRTVKVSEQEETRSTGFRKSFLAHPFFQPLEGRIGSVTDISYAGNSFNFSLLNVNIYKNDYETVMGSGAVDLHGKAEVSQFLVTENISLGLTDTLAVVGMAAYDSTKTTFSDWAGSSLSDWAQGVGANKNSTSGINVFGLGIQTRFIDTDKYIGLLSGFYKHEKNSANVFTGEVKVGHKIKRTTIYGLVNLNYYNLTEGDTYGMVVNGQGGDQMVLAYQTGVKSAMFAEVGAGVFSVLNKYLTAKGEFIYGSYDWHNQINLKAEFGYQPNDSFALNLYGMINVYDSANGMKKTYGVWDFAPSDYTSESMVYRVGDYEISKYNEWKFGAQAIFYF